AAPAANPPAVGETEQRDASVALAARFSTAAHEAVGSDKVVRDPAAWRQAIVYLTAASRLDPGEPRYPRLRSDALSQLGDADGSAKALEEYLELVKNDDVARLRLIEYYAARMQTTDGRLKYIVSLLDKPSVSNEVKSRCATWAAVLLGERSRQQQVDMLARAIQLDPVNLYARRLEYELLTSGGAGPEERLTSLFAQLRCDPGQVRVLATIGRELEAVGLHHMSLEWTASAINLSSRSKESVGFDVLVEYAVQLYLDGRAQAADETIAGVLEADSLNLDAWYLRLTLRKAAGLQVAFEQDQDRAKRVFAARAGAIARKVLADPAPSQPGGTGTAAATGPSSRPIDFSSGFSADGAGGATAGGPVNPAAAANEEAPTSQRLKDAIARLNRPDAPADLRADFVSAVADLAWFELYFERSEAAAKTWVDAMAELVPATDGRLLRFRGWLDLVAGRRAEAIKTLWPLHDRDPFAGLGVVAAVGGPVAPPPAASQPAATNPAATTAGTTRPAAARPPTSTELAQSLLDNNPSGLVAAMLMADLKERKLVAKPVPVAEAMKKVVDAFPTDLMRVVDQPERFYSLNGERTKVPYRLGEPVLATVSLTNLSKYDLPIGQDGVIKSDLWFDARLSLGADRPFPMAAHDKIAGPLVLKAKSTTNQIVRVDQGELAAALRERPAGSINLYMTVMTNPFIRPDFRVVAGPGGVRRQFVDPLIRGGMPVAQEPDRKRLREGLDGLPSQKMWTVDVLTALVEQARGADAEPNVQHHAADFTELVARTRKDRVPEVGAWATYAALELAPPEDPSRVPLADALAASPTWEGRLLAVRAARGLDPASRSRIASALAGDANDLVKTAAAAEAELASRGPATKPAGPATGSASPPLASPGPALPSGPALPGGPTLPSGTGGTAVPLPGGPGSK
ncbi:MAG: hypothetical protein JWO31_1232, partial [Phycisphaerales bacterium]|nr:hypothetical protein [Phycisphaerales bacterium]